MKSAMDFRESAHLGHQLSSNVVSPTPSCMQVDAAVLQAVLDSSPRHRPAKSSLVAGALDVVEVALNNTAHYICSPSLWLALAGCGNPTVSATYAAVAAQLAPITATAVAKAGSMHLTPEAQQQLEQSLLLPNAETVALDSLQHTQYALDHSGWLHGQLMKAAGVHDVQPQPCTCAQWHAYHWLKPRGCDSLPVLATGRCMRVLTCECDTCASWLTL